MDDQASAPIAANDAEAKVADIVLLANNAREAAAALGVALLEIEAKKAASVNLAAEVEQILTDARSMKAAAEGTLTEAKSKAEQLSASVSAREDEILAKLAAAETRVNSKIAELEEGAASSQARVDQASSELAQRSATRLGELDAASQRATADQQNATANAESVANVLTQAQQHLAEIEAAKANVIAHQAITAEATAAKQKFDAEASALLAGEVDRFQRAFADIGQYQKSFAQDCDSFAREINRLTEAAEGMLFGATNAGLGAVFKEEVKACDRNIIFCTVMFIIGMAAFGVSLIPLVNYMSHVASGNAITLAEVVARGLLVLPASWFCLHFARRIHAAIELRAHWVHKYTVAATVEPFRQQAGEHVSAAVLATLEQLMKNPAWVLRRHQKMSDPPTEVVAEATKPVTDGIRRLLSGPQAGGTNQP